MYVCSKILNMKKLSALLIFFIAVTFASKAQSIISVDSARTNNANGVPVDSGLVVEVTGVVYGPNAYPTPNGDVFMLRGQNLSIRVYSSGTFGYTVHDGDSVTVIGTLSTYHGDAEINLKYNVAGDTIIKLPGTGTVLPPYVVSVIGENDESQLIQVNNIDMSLQSGWTVPHPKHSFNVHVGSIYLFIDSFMSPDLWNLSAAPTGVYNIVGFGSQYASSYPYNNGYSIQPRSLADFHLVSGINEATGTLAAAVYPNPASTKLTVTFSYDQRDAYTAHITDLTGRVVMADAGEVMSGDNTIEFNTTNLTNGMYILEVRTSDKVLTSKINIAK
jgi:Secretion system C-terminal sorting domain